MPTTNTPLAVTSTILILLSTVFFQLLDKTAALLFLFPLSEPLKLTNVKMMDHVA